MFSTTLFVHIANGCMGSIVLDPSQSVKLVAPSFSLSDAGIAHFTLDLHLEADAKMSGGIIKPDWLCVKCNEHVSPDRYEDDMATECQVCGHTQPIGQILVHSRISSVCKSCFDQMKNLSKGVSPSSPRISEYAEMFGIKSGARATALSDVISKPYSI